MRYTDDVMARNVYPESRGASLGTTATSPSSQGPAVSGGASDAAQAAEGAAQRGGAQPLVYWGAFLVALLVLFYVAQRVGDSSEFANIKATAYNFLVIGLIAVVSIPPIKLAASKLPIPALRDYVLAV
jgi:hypothetical protein